MFNNIQARIDSIQVLRAIAAILVVLYHAQDYLTKYKLKYGIDDAWLNLVDHLRIGQCGVDIFFVISGFIMALITNDLHKHKGAIKNFCVKRLIRILPIYWLYTFIMIFAFIFFQQLSYSGRSFKLNEAMLSLLLIPYSPVESISSPLLVPGWTLSYEMYFYALISIGLLFSRKQFIIGLGILFLITTIIFPQRHGPISNLTSNPILWEFYAGSLLFEFYKTSKSLSGIFSICLLIFAITILGLITWSSSSKALSLRCIYFGVPALIIVTSFLFLEKTTGYRVPNFLTFLGDSSYSIYLSHALTLPVIRVIFPMVGLHQILPPDVQIIIFTVIGVACGCILYVIIEKPLLSFLKNKLV